MKKLSPAQSSLKNELEKGRTFSQYNLGDFNNMLRWDDTKETINVKVAIALNLTWTIKYNF